MCKRLSDSLLSAYDTITDFVMGEDRIDAPSQSAARFKTPAPGRPRLFEIPCVLLPSPSSIPLLAPPLPCVKRCFDGYSRVVMIVDITGYVAIL